MLLTLNPKINKKYALNFVILFYWSFHVTVDDIWATVRKKGP